MNKFSSGLLASVYVMASGGGFVMVGVAQRPHRLLAKVARNHPHKLGMARVWPMTAVEARRVAEAARGELSGSAAMGDWFSCDVATASATIDWIVAVLAITVRRDRPARRWRSEDDPVPSVATIKKRGFLVARRAKPGPIMEHEARQREREIRRWDEFKGDEPEGRRQSLKKQIADAEELGIIIRRE